MADGTVDYNYVQQPFPHPDAPGVSVFYKDDAGQIYLTYSTYGRGVEVVMHTYNFLDLTPLGRNEDGLAYPMEWVRHHDRYETAAVAAALRAARRALEPEGGIVSGWLPWLAVSGVGALHGLNPATGWMFEVARGVRASDSGQALRALVPIAVGHAASMALVAAAVASGLVMDRAML